MKNSMTFTWDKDEQKLDCLEHAKLMLEAALITARCGLIDLSKWFAEDAKQWKNYEHQRI